MKIDDYRLSLETSGLKNTKARQGVIQTLQKEQRPLDVPEIIFFLSRMKVKADQATVYRIMEKFTQNGIVKRLEFNEGKYRYELMGEEHHHLICENCGTIEDFSDCNLVPLENEIRKKKNFTVSRHALEFYGICKKCQ